MLSEPAKNLFETDEQQEVFAALLEKIGAGPAALYTDACMLRARPDMLIATAPLVAHALREVERAIVGRFVPAPLQTCAACGGQRRDTPAQIAVFSALGVLPNIELLKDLRTEGNELAHRAGLQRPRSFDADFMARVTRFDTLFLSVLTSLAVPGSAAAPPELMERLRTRPASPVIDQTDRERKVLESLLNKVAPGPAAWYADALALHNDRFSFLFARANLIAHALREAESGLRDVLLAPEFVPVTCETCNETINGHQQEITAILQAYEITGDDETARLWREFAGPAATSGLAGLAHKSSLDLPKPFDAGSAEVFTNVSKIFATLFAKFDFTFGRYVKVLDELLQAKQLRKKKEIAAFKGAIPHTDLTYDYFFTRATNPQWLTDLHNHDAFRLTPEPYRREGAHVFPAWPQGVYLRRLLAAGSADVAEIFSIVERATVSENPRVHEGIVRAALLMDAERRQQIAEREREWLEQGRYIPFLLGEALGELATAVAADGASQLAVSILRLLLQLVEVTENNEKDLRLRVDRLAYDHLLDKSVPTIAVSCNTAILTVVADALDTLRAFERPALTVPPVDYSYIWRAAVEPNERTLRGGLRDALIDSLRDASETIVRAHAKDLETIVEWLESRRWNIYRRIGLHLVAASSNSDLAASLASRADYLEELDLRHEMSRMVRAHAHQLRDDVPKEVLSQRNVLRNAEPRLGGAEAFWVQEHSPLSPDTIQTMSVPALVEFIQTWTPPPRDFLLSGQTHGALAGVIRNVVPHRHSEFSAAAMLFAGLRPGYIRSLLEGLDEVLQRGETIEWQPVMDLGLWVADQQRAAGDHHIIDPFAEEETWRYVRRAWLDVLEHATWCEKPLLPPEHWRMAWHLLQRFALDPDAGDQDDGVVDADAEARSVIFALHSVSGKAFSLLIRFPRILRQMQMSEEDVATTRSHVLTVVDSHLQAPNATPPTFTVIGRLFLDLIALDRERAHGLAAALFGATTAGRAAWSAYLTNGVMSECATLLLHQYSTAIDALDSTASKASFLEKCLAAHILTLYRAGALSLGDQDLIASFFAHASPTLRAEALWDVARSLSQVSQSQLPRLVALWEWCSRRLPPHDLRAFESWACSRKFDDIWVLDQLLDLAQRGTKLSCYRLVEYLEDTFDKDPRRVTRTIAATVEHQKGDHEVHASRHAIGRIVKRAHEAGEPAREEGRRLANLMTAVGFTDEFKEWT